MGRRIPSLGTIEKIADALKIPCYELLMYDPGEKKEERKPQTGDYLQELPQKVKKEIISHLLSAINNDVKSAFDPKNYQK